MVKTTNEGETPHDFVKRSNFSGPVIPRSAQKPPPVGGWPPDKPRPVQKKRTLTASQAVAQKLHFQSILPRSRKARAEVKTKAQAKAEEEARAKAKAERDRTLAIYRQHADRGFV